MCCFKRVLSLCILLELLEEHLKCVTVIGSCRGGCIKAPQRQQNNGSIREEVRKRALTQQMSLYFLVVARTRAWRGGLRRAPWAVRARVSFFSPPRELLMCSSGNPHI